MMNTVNANTSERDIFLQQLRGDTAYWHRKLEGLELSKAILADDVSAQQYLQYLKTMYGFIRPFETMVYPQLATLVPDIGARHKTALLEKDLKILGMNDTAIGQIPLRPMATHRDDAQAMGMMYVLEGSTLGGAVIGKHIYNTLGIDAQSGAAYLQPYGQQAGSYWKAFVGHMLSFVLEQKQEKELIAAATATFKDIHDWFLHF